MDPKIAQRDFLERVRAYELVYETIADDEDSNQISYIKLINVGQKVISRNCTGYLPSQVAFYLQNVHIQPRKIFLSLSSETLSSAHDSYKCQHSECLADQLTDRGRQYSLDLARYIQIEHDTSEGQSEKGLLVISETAGVHAETILHLRMLYSCYTTPLLNDLRGGDLHGLTHEEIKLLHPR